MTTDSGSFLPVEESLRPTSASAIADFDIGSIELVREFMEHMVAKNTSQALGNGRSTRYAIDWGAVEASIAGSRTLEQAIGRAVVLADQVSRRVCNATESGDSPSLSADSLSANSLGADQLSAEDPFFAFSLADVVPDFGDESRYRTRVVRRMAKVFGTRSTAVPDSGTVLGRHLPGNAVLNS